jgi:Na+-translocating ferredoxin:NAD+ oxidoreductase RnfD subunit
MDVLKFFQNLDQRYYQMAFLLTLFVYAKFVAKLPHMEWWYVATIFLSIQIFQYYFSKVFKIKYDWRSPFISGTAITILMATTSFRAAVFVAFFTVAFKFLVRYNGKHIFNPNNISIVLTILTFPTLAKIAPYQWGLNSISTAIFVILAGIVVSRSVKSYDIALYFYAMYGFSMFVIFTAGLFSGSLVLHMISIPITLFTFFMITDPIVIPNTSSGRFVFALFTVFVSNLIYIFTSFAPAFIFALPFASLITPFIDSYFGGENFQWKKGTIGDGLKS